MAYTVSARYSITLVDELGTEASDTYYALLDPTQTIQLAIDAWAALAAVVDPITGGQIIRGGITILPVPAGLKGAPVAGSRVEQTGVFNFLDSITTHRYGQALPSLRDSKIVAGKINLVDVAVAAFITFLTAVLAVAEWVNNHQQPLTALRDALISFRKRRKQLARSSFEL
jgi:hypothetical protein